MSIPVIKQGDILVIPLSSIYNRGSMPLDGNADTPVRQRWFDASDVVPIIIKPDLHSQAVVRNPQGDSKPRELNISLFLGNGSGLT